MYINDLFSNQNLNNTFETICDALNIENNTPAWPDRFGEAINKWLSDNNIEPIRTLSLFSGAGGLDIGFSDIGFDIVSSVEIEEKFCKTLELNTGKGRRFESSTVNCIDIREFSGDNLGKVDFIIGGPPCQTFSAAGRRANGVLGTTDARGVLFREYVRLLKKLSPKGFLFENVYGITGAQGGEAWKEILQSFSEVGYKLYYRILDAADYGVPQHRERLIIVGLKDGEFKFPRPTHGLDSIGEIPHYNAGTAVAELESKENTSSCALNGRFGHLLNDIPPGLNYSFYTEEMGHPTPIFAWRSKFSDFLYKADPNTPVRTIKASGGAYTGPLSWENRFFTYEEYKRLQTFPDSYEISGKKQVAVKQIGNSVPPQLARMMAIAIRMQVFGTKFPFELSMLENYEELTFRKHKRDLTQIYRKKAAQAIKSIKNEEGSLPDSRNYYCSILSNFKYQEVEECDADFKVVVEWGGTLSIKIEDIKGPTTTTTISVTIKPKGRGWNIGVSDVTLSVASYNPFAYTVAWKAFERELVKNAIKADLVQLNGYYHSKPILDCDCSIDENFPYHRAISKIVTRNAVPTIVCSEQLAKFFDVEQNQLMEVAIFLKSIGYEIRNHATNPQIEEDNWLIPYSFPTLSPLSVQLWKKLK